MVGIVGDRGLSGTACPILGYGLTFGSCFGVSVVLGVGVSVEILKLKF